MPPQPPWYSGQGFPVERAERAEYNEHGVSGASRMPSVNQAHNEMSLADKIRHQQQPPFSAPVEMETDEPTQPYSAYVPRKEGGGENSYAVPPIVKMSQGPGPSAPAVSAPSVGNNSSQSPTKTYSAAPSSSANHGAGQSKPAPSSQIVPSRGARTPLPDMEEIDMEMAPVRVAGKRPVLTRAESSNSMGNGYMAIHDADASGRAEPNAIVSRVSGQTGYKTWAERLPDGGRGKLSKMAEEVEVTGYSTYATPGAMSGKYARAGTERAVIGINGRWRVIDGDTEMVV